LTWSSTAELGTSSTPSVLGVAFVGVVVVVVVALSGADLVVDLEVDLDVDLDADLDVNLDVDLVVDLSVDEEEALACDVDGALDVQDLLYQ